VSFAKAGNITAPQVGTWPLTELLVDDTQVGLSLIHISEPTRLGM